MVEGERYGVASEPVRSDGPHEVVVLAQHRPRLPVRLARLVAEEPLVGDLRAPPLELQGQLPDGVAVRHAHGHAEGVIMAISIALLLSERLEGGQLVLQAPLWNCRVSCP